MRRLFGNNDRSHNSGCGRSGIDEFRGGKSYPCPSCGANIGLNEPHSYRAILTDAVRTSLNGLLIDARNFTRGLDTFLARLSHRLDMHDPFGTPYVREELNHLIRAGLIDRATWLDLTADPSGDPDSDEARDRRSRTAEENQSEPSAAPVINGSLRETVYQQLDDGDALSLIRQNQNHYGVLSSDTEAGRWAEYFQLLLDTHDFDHNFAGFPLLDADNVDDAEKCRSYAKLLLGPALERRGNALLLNLIEEQPSILEFKQSGWLEKHQTAINKLIAHLRPELGRYFEFIEAHLDKLGGDADAVRANLQRGRFLLLVLHGHGWRMLSEDVRAPFQEALAEDFEDFGRLFLNGLFAFPDQAEISGELLSRMLAARMILQTENRSLAEWLPNWVRDLFSKVTPGSLRRDPERNWLEHIGKLIVVQCANQIEADRIVLVPDGSSANQGDGGQAQEAPAAEQAAGMISRGLDSLVRRLPWRRIPDNVREETVRLFVPCGYTLSEYPTYSIVLLGSPGTGKTTAFEAGLAKLWRIAEGLGLDLTPVDPESTALIGRIQNQFFEGRIQAPTEVNLALNFEASLIRDPGKRIRVSVIDVPGEKVNALASGKGADSELRRILRHANTIVFQFDLWSDKTLWRQLAASGSKEFESQLQLAESLERKRREKEGYFSDQSLLLSRLISMLESERPAAELAALNFLCLFPKIDTLAASNGKPASHLVFSDMMKDLRSKGLLVSGRLGDAEGQGNGKASSGNEKPRHISGLGELESLAGLGLLHDSPLFQADAVSDDNEQDGDARGSSFARQVAICRTLSQATKQSLKRLGDMLPPESPEGARVAFSERVLSGVIGKVETHFSSSFFLPVSALGRSPTVQENEQRLINRPNSVLVEYAFLLPLMAAFEESYPARES